MVGLLVQNQSHRAGTHLRGKLIRRIPHQTFFSGEMVSANPGAVHTSRSCLGLATSVGSAIRQIVDARVLLTATAPPALPGRPKLSGALAPPLAAIIGLV